MDINLLESVQTVQRRMTKIIHDVRHLEYPDRLKALGLHSLERHKCRGDMIEVFKWKNGINKGDISEDLKMKEKSITQSNGLKVDKFMFKKDTGKYWIGNRVVDLWNSLPPAVINSNSVDSFKAWLDSHMRSLGWIWVDSA